MATRVIEQGGRRNMGLTVKWVVEIVQATECGIVKLKEGVMYTRFFVRLSKARNV